MLSVCGNDDSINNKRILCRSYSDSELVKNRGSEIETRLTGHYSFSTSNLRSKQIMSFKLSSDDDKMAKRKKGRKSISHKIKGLRRLLSFRKKKRKSVDKTCNEK